MDLRNDTGATNNAIGFYLLEHHLSRLQNAIQDFRSVDANVFVNAPSNQDIVNELDAKVPLDDSYHRVHLSIAFCSTQCRSNFFLNSNRYDYSWIPSPK